MIIGNGYWAMCNSTRETHGYGEGFWGYGSGLMANNTNRYFTFNQKNGIPSGYSPPYSWAPPIKRGGLATMVKSTSSIQRALLAGAKSLSATIQGSGQLTSANLQMIVAFSAFIQGQGSISKADLRGIVSLAATVQASGNVNNAALSAIANMSAHIQGSGNISYAELFGTMSLSAHIYVNEGAATVDQLVEGVWTAQTADHTAPGTTGKALTDAGSAGNPWASDTITNNDPGTFGELVQKDIKQKLIPMPGLILGA